LKKAKQILTNILSNVNYYEGKLMVMTYRNTKRCYSSSFCLLTYFSYLDKVLTNILHRKICKIARNFSEFLRNFCYNFHATFWIF